MVQSSEKTRGGGLVQPPPPPPAGGAVRRPAGRPYHCPSCKKYHNSYSGLVDLDSDVVGVDKPPTSSGNRCYKECPTLGLLRGPGGFLGDEDVKTARYRLNKVEAYKKHLVQQRNAEDTTGKASLYQVVFLTNRQKRVVAYYKIFRHIYTKGKYREVLPLPSCVCFVIRKWWPDDDDDRRLRGDVGNVADSTVIEEEEEEGEGGDEEEGGE
jgi:hypothetical protein